MLSKRVKLFWLFSSLWALLPARAVLADTGPKPTMEFEFKQEAGVGPVTIVSGILYECDQSDCSDAAPLQEGGPQGFFCDANGCRALAYGFATYHKIEIEFSDGTVRESNIFETAGFDSIYTVTVRPDDLLVEAQFSLGVLSPATWLIIACVCILGMGAGLVGLIIFLIRRSRKK